MIQQLEVVRFGFKGKEVLIRDYRDTFPLNKDFMIVRPYFRSLNSGGIFVDPRYGDTVDLSKLEPIPQLLPSKDLGEVKTGGSAITYLGNDEYLLLYHVVTKCGVYYTYAALLRGNRELVSLTKSPILPTNSKHYIGRRVGTLFVCGVARYGDYLIISAGKDDEVTLIFRISINDLLSLMKSPIS